MLLSDNRGRLRNGGGSLCRAGALNFWSRTAFLVLLFAALMVVALYARFAAHAK